jgi:DNA invertase Pin-like site-specific DNA recombinase
MSARNPLSAVAPTARSAYKPVVVGAALAALIVGSLAALLGSERRRRRRADQARPGERSASSAQAVPPTRTHSGGRFHKVDEASRAPTSARIDKASARAQASSRATKICRPGSRGQPGKRAIGYLTVPTDPRSNQARASSDFIAAACARSGWNLVEVVRDRENGRVLERPGLRYALERIASQEANALVIGELERLSRSIVDLGALMAWFRDTDATLVALDLRIDTSTREGYHVATTLIALGNWEHERIARRTRSGLAEVRANGQPTGRPAVSDRPELVQRISEMRAANLSLRAIAEQLNAEQIPTLRGGKEWRPSSIQAALGYRRPGPRDNLPSVQKSPRP